MNSKKISKELLRRINLTDAIDDLVEGASTGDNVCCPFPERHESGNDSTPSFGVDPDNAGRSFCQGCGYKSSTIVGLAQDLLGLSYRNAIKHLWTEHVEKLVPDSNVSHAHGALANNPLLIGRLKKKRGISEAAVLRHRLGWAGDRLWIPIENEQGLVVDVRKHDLLGRRKAGAPKIFSYGKKGDGFGGARIYPLSSLKRSVVVLCEGELDAILAIDRGINAVTITSGAHTMPAELAKKFKGLKVLVVPDNDKAGLAGARKRAKALTKAGARVILLDPPPWPKGKDLGDWLHGGGGNAELLRQAASGVGEEEAKPVASVALEFETSEAENEMVERAELVLSLLESRGGFFRGNDGESYYAERAGSGSMAVGGAHFLGHLSRINPAINSATSSGRFVINHLKSAALGRASKVTMGAWSLYHNQSVYLYAGKGRTLCATPKSVTMLDDSVQTHSVLIDTPREHAAVKWIKSAQPNEAVAAAWSIVGRNIACDDSYRYLSMCWIMSLYFREYIRAKPILRFVASSGGGKTTATKLISHLIYGEEVMSHSASTIASSYAMAQSHPILLFDNVETRNLTQPFEDFLLTAATGGSKTKRASGTDSAIVTEQVNCLIGTNGIEPFSRNELIARTIEIELDLEKYGRANFHEYREVKRASEQRHQILSGWLKLAQQSILPRIKSGEVSRIAHEFPHHSMERFNDHWALMAICSDICFAFRPSNKWNTARDLVSEWLEEQDRSASERKQSTSELLYYLETLVDRHGSLSDTRVKITERDGKTYLRAQANQLLTDFQILAKHLGQRCPWSNARQLGVRLVDAESMLSNAGWTRSKKMVSGRMLTVLTKEKR